jgi:DNA-directed RNA polymerase subunit RPC12/RpoP
MIESFACDLCDFQLPTGWGGYVYVTTDAGKRVVCPHPGEFETIQRITGLGYSEADAAGRVGFNDHCVCVECLKQFDLDLKRDARACPACSGSNVNRTRELVDQPCPSCKKGTIRRGSPIRWKLDPDRNVLPVPAIVKDIALFAETRVPSAALQPAYDAIQTVEGIRRNDFFVICIHLLGWWQGDYFSDDTDPKPSLGPYDLKWPWVQGFRRVVECIPELHRLLRWHNGSWYFRDEISADEKRGIKNYAREHYRPPVMS